MRYIRKASPLFFLVFILTLSLFHIVYATPTFIQITPTSGNATTTPTLSNIKINDLLYVAGFVQANSCASTISDSLSNTWTLSACGQASQVGGCASQSLSIWTTISTSAGTDIVTVANAFGIGGVFADYSGITSVGTAVSHSGTSATDTITVTQNQQGAIESTFALQNNGSCNAVTQSPTSGQITRSTAATAGGPGLTADSLSIVTGSASYQISFTATGSLGWIHTLLPISGTAQSTTNLSTICFGNCGSPAITIVNTNSTHLINFNTSITLFYEFQSTLNGVINNVTLNYAQICGSGNKCTANTLFIGAYIIGSCPANSQPFTSACPGSRVSQATFSPPTKARLSMQCPSSCVITSGQWIGIAVSATFSGIDINDTNINVPLFQTTGITPNTIQSSSSASSLCAGCKMGLWAWVTGNVVTGTTPPNVSGNCGNGIGDFLTCNTLSFCTGTPNAGCQLAGGLFWALVYSGGGMILLMWGDRKLAGQGEEGERIIPGEVYFFIPIGVFLMFTALGVLPSWVAVLIFAVAAYLLADLILRRGRD